jgi:hypothetical protein
MFLSLENIDSREYSFHMLTQYSQGKNVHENAVSKLDVIVPGDTFVSSIQQNRPIFHKVNVSPTQNSDR